MPLQTFHVPSLVLTSLVLPSATANVEVLGGADTELQRVLLLLGSLQYFIDIILPAALWPRGDSVFNRNEYQEYFLGVRAAGA